MGKGGGEIVKVSLGEILEGSIKDRDPCKERPLLMYQIFFEQVNFFFNASFKILKSPWISRKIGIRVFNEP
jgi:hypothetical protein